MSPAPLIYMMNATTAPLDPRVRAVMVPLLEEDPRRPDGLLADERRIGEILTGARARVASFCGAAPGEIVFTSSGTEACNLAIKGTAIARMARRMPPGRVVVAATERTAVLYPARSLGRIGFDTAVAPVDRHGRVDRAAIEALIGPDTFLVSVAVATAETGTLQDVAAIAAIAHDHGALLHADACLAAAYGPVDVKRLNVDLASFSAHMIGGPRGAGALYVREGVRLQPLIEGGTAEGGRRGGTESVAAIAGFGEAAALARVEVPGAADRIGEMGAVLEGALLSHPGVSLNGHPERRLRGMVNVSVRGVDGEAMLLKLARAGVAATSGSSCFQEIGKPSHVLRAMGIDAALAQGSVLFAAGRLNSLDEARRLASIFPEAVESLRALSPRGTG